MIQLSHVEKSYGGKTLYRDASFQLEAGDRVGLVGANGSGKTTLFRLIVGEESPQSGQVSRFEKWSVAYFSQDVAEMSGRSAFEEVLSGGGRVIEVAERLKVLEERLAEPLDEV